MAVASKKRVDFFNSEEGKDARDQLNTMLADKLFNTPAHYTSNSSQYPDNLIPFVDKHMNHLNAFPYIQTRDYIKNLRLMTRIKH